MSFVEWTPSEMVGNFFSNIIQLFKKLTHFLWCIIEIAWVETAVMLITATIKIMTYNVRLLSLTTDVLMQSKNVGTLNPIEQTHQNMSPGEVSHFWDCFMYATGRHPQILLHLMMWTYGVGYSDGATPSMSMLMSGTERTVDRFIVSCPMILL